MQILTRFSGVLTLLFNLNTTCYYYFETIIIIMIGLNYKQILVNCLQLKWIELRIQLSVSSQRAHSLSRFGRKPVGVKD